MFSLHLLKLLILFDLIVLSLLFVFFIPCGSLFLYSFFSSFYVLINYLYDSIYIFALIFNDYLRDFTIMHPWLFRIKLVHLSTSLTMQNFYYSSLCLSPFFLGSSSSCYYGHIFYFYLCYKPYKTSLLLHSYLRFYLSLYTYTLPRSSFLLWVCASICYHFHSAWRTSFLTSYSPVQLSTNSSTFHLAENVCTSPSILGGY